jgi:BASS family bile acid:Na+ symporter
MNELLQTVARLSVPTFIVSSMLAMGLGLSAQVVVAPLRSPRRVASALFVNFVLSPAIAYGLTRLFPLEPAHATGLILLSLAAGAPFLPNLAEIARSDFVLIAALLVLLTAGTILFMPFALPLLAPGFSAGPWTVARPLVLMIGLPLVAAMVVAARAPGVAATCKPILKAISSLSLLLALVLIVGLNLSAMWGVVGSGAILASLVFTALVFVAGYALGGRLPGDKGATGLAAAARNVGAALPVATIQGDPKVIVMLLVATLAGLPVLLAAAGVLRRRAAGTAAPPPDESRDVADSSAARQIPAVKS